MKSLNQQVFEILERKFPGEFKYVPEYRSSGYYPGDSEYCREYIKKLAKREEDERTYIFSECIYDAFWLAEKVGLFKIMNLSQFNEQWIIVNTRGEEYFCFEADTIPEVICRAVIAIYGGEGK